MVSCIQPAQAALQVLSSGQIYSLIKKRRAQNWNGVLLRGSLQEPLEWYGRPLSVLELQGSLLLICSSNNYFSSGTKVNHPLGQLKEILFAFTSSQPVLTCIADPDYEILHEMWPQLGPYIPSYCSEFFSKACNALLPWPQFSLLRKGCKEWIAFFSCYLDKEKDKKEYVD